MSFSRYPVYKDSSVKWLGEVPEHWLVERLKNVAIPQVSTVDKHVLDNELLVEVCNYTHVYYHRQISSSLSFSQGSVTEKELIDFRLRQGDVIITKDSETPEDIAVPSLVVEDILNLVCGYHLAILRAKTDILDGQYLYFAQESKLARAYYTNIARGVTRFGLPYQGIANCPIPLPPLPEQRAIAAFLDRETARIDALVAKQETLIALLHEKRRALISHAVTKGLDRDAPMKDSGVAWLGEVPAHWEVKRLLRIAYLHRGYDLTADERVEGNVPVVTSGGVVAFHNEAKANGPGVAMGRYGTTGEIFYIEQDYWPHNTALYVEEFHGNLPRFVYYLLQILPFGAHSSKSAVPGIDRNDLHVLLVCEPPLHEQQTVVAFLERKTAQIDTLIARAEQLIALLREHRTALIAAAVTGKIDVRGIVPDLELVGEV